LTGAADLKLHLPDEPTVRAEAWLAQVLDGQDLADVLAAPDGLTNWLWARWSTLASAGMSQETFAAIVREYRRELWLWLAGERTWVQACSGLLGRVGRRVQVAAVGG
jgi:hypothetical protein